MSQKKKPGKVKACLKRAKRVVKKRSIFDFRALVTAIRQADEQLVAQASKAVNMCLTLRNWAIGLYIYEYEQNGSDRAKYGQQLLEILAERLNKCGLPRVEARELRRYRQFYATYPQIRESLTPELHYRLFGKALKACDRIRESPTPKLTFDGKALVNRLSFTHFVELVAIEDTSKRFFYESECIRGNWSVRELKRQIGSLYYERSALSTNKKALVKRSHTTAQRVDSRLTIRDPYVFEFLGLKSKEVMCESSLQDALLARLQDFILELGKGFCFEGRQKRILIGDEYFFVDLVFYHRILKCHVLFELKIDGFSHEYLGQLNTYVNWFRKNEMDAKDNPPIGILLCTHKNDALIEYALGGLNNKIFVSRYKLQLPKPKEIQRFIQRQIELHDTTQ
ncbi:MAG TPA: PDDEXK nuclease domain-containing protein [Candidatus Hydrogenedentes bacterium]|mgnify:CR=1 FL=1|nr:PDDEXK nuclease domain-containing protein [Candidatus Hydrogenedentota bacterium]